MYTITNVTGRSYPDTDNGHRRPLDIDGSRLYPERSMKKQELTSDILKGLRRGTLQVRDERGTPVTIASLRDRGYAISESITPAEETQPDGTTETVHYRQLELVEVSPAGDEEAEPDASVDAEGESDVEEGGTEEDNGVNEEAGTGEEGGTDTTGDEAAGDASASNDDPRPPVIQTLADRGVITDDTAKSRPVTASTDMKAAAMVKIIEQIGDRLPDGFFDAEERKTVLAALNE